MEAIYNGIPPVLVCQTVPVGDKNVLKDNTKVNCHLKLEIRLRWYGSQRVTKCLLLLPSTTRPTVCLIFHTYYVRGFLYLDEQLLSMTCTWQKTAKSYFSDIFSNKNHYQETLGSTVSVL